MTGACKWCGMTVTSRLLSGVALWFDWTNDSRCEDNEPHAVLIPVDAVSVTL